ncbi:MAG: ferrous iron transport protein B [Ruminococcaceae bacterium]|nr:ferrous iron transport protein B [Oscillospiraceae bacterium]
MRIAFAGNPNSGKTTMYNALTGRNEHVGNWAGVTVDRKEASIKKSYAGDAELIAVDLPGAYSMSPFTSEESVTSAYVQSEHPDVIINIVDATNLSRSLFFTTQLLELGIPVVVALNKSDVNKKKKTHIDANTLALKLGCPVVETASASSGHEGLAELVKAAIAVAGKGQIAPYDQGVIDLTSKKAVEAADRRRFAFVNGIVAAVETRKVLTKDKNFQDKIDAVLTFPMVGLLIFAAVMFLVFQISQAWLGPWIAEGYEFENGTVIPGLVTLIDMFKEWVAGLLENANANVFLAALLTEGIIGGVSAVVGFLPLVMVMYFLIALLEDCGYMARATVVLDPIFKKVGLSGKSVIPFVIGTGCAIPGVMAARTIRNERERNATAMLAPFMPCGAKLPVIALFAGAFFDEASWVGTLMYFVGIVLILLGALLVNKIAGHKNRKSFFIMELPEYKLPSLKRACVSMLSRGWAYIVKAGTIILLCNAVVYIMQSFNWQFQLVEEGMEGTSILASIANPIAVLLVPVIGITAWQMAAAAVTGFIAKENVVGTLAVCYGISNLIDTESLEMAGGASAEVAAVFGLTKVAALAYLMFNLFSPPCFAALGAMNAEIKQKKWFWGGIGLQLGTGYSVGYLVYTIGTLITGEVLNVPAAIGGGAFVLAFAAVLVYLCVNSDKKIKAEYAMSGKK